MSETKQEQGLQRMPQRSFSLLPSSLGEAKEIATMIANSDFAPKDYRGKPDNVLVAIQMGADLGLKPMQALQNIAVINGRPSIYGDAALALAMDVLEKFTEGSEGEYPKDDFKYVCISKRKGWPDETRREFSIEDAKKANLWGKAGPWQSYPKRMLQMRARGFNLRDVASDRLLGLVLAEEAQDYPAIDAQIVSSEIVPAPSAALTTFEQLPEGIRERIEKGFAALNLSAAQRLVKVNEYIGVPDLTPEDGAEKLLDWLKDEYAKRRTGQPRAKKAGNEKPKAKQAEAVQDPAPEAPAPVATPVDPVVEGQVVPPADDNSALF